MSSHQSIPRRQFLSRGTSCAAHLALAGALLPRALRTAWPGRSRGNVIAREPFGNLEHVADNVWALISTPLGGDSTTVSNGGIIAGRNIVLAIEGFNRPQGAAWMAARARELTGRWPTHVLVTHYHADHANGVAGYLQNDEHPVLRTTSRTRDLVVERNIQPADPNRVAAMKDVVVESSSDSTVLDLGGREIRLAPRDGHTDSDISVHLSDQNVVFCGDLFWNGMFPNYVDAIPTRLSTSARALRGEAATTYVPGHGPIGRSADFDRYVSMIDEVEHGARSAYAAGTPSADAAARFTLSPALGEWTMFNKVFFQRAFDAWYRVLATK
ncbi:MAG TPA: MBL fold metallo-hydrolase [Gemmatimonadaceae bacterium]|nr:MBL fold metallo-hydrolase [Gemmatimonadaceae bacterium]